MWLLPSLQILNNTSRTALLFSRISASHQHRAKAITRRGQLLFACVLVNPLHSDAKGCPLILGASQHIIGPFKIRAMPTIHFFFFFECLGKKRGMRCPLRVIYLPGFYNTGYHVPLWATSLDISNTIARDNTTLTGRTEPWLASTRETGKMHVIGENLWLPSRQ